MAQTLEQFGQTIKAKYPQYNDISDAELGQKMLVKYPQYQDMVVQKKKVQQITETPDQISAEQTGATFPSKVTDKPLTAAAKYIGNIPSSGYQLGKGILSMPYNIGQQLGEIGTGAYEYGKEAGVGGALKGFAKELNPLSVAQRTLGVLTPMANFALKPAEAALEYGTAGVAKLGQMAGIKAPLLQRVKESSIQRGDIAAQEAQRELVNNPANAILQVLGAAQGLKATDPAVFNRAGDFTTKYTGVKTAENILGKAKEAVKTTLPKPENIMNRVARLTPLQAEGFRKLSGGESHGEYLARTGNFESPQKVVQNEAVKFANSLKETDAAIEKLPGEFKSETLDTVLTDLVKREAEIGVPTAETSKITSLFDKHQIEGLTMSEINQVKRIYERTVKLGYLKERNTVGIERSTRLDSALRKWQFKTAESLGLKNLPELNKQTQLSKYIVNNLGKQLGGKVGNNAITLTDWIVLSGGNPTAIAAFFAKKLLSSQGFQAGVAKKLANKPFSKPITAEFTTPQTTRTGLLQQELLPNQLEKSYNKSIPQSEKNARGLLSKENQITKSASIINEIKNFPRDKTLKGDDAVVQERAIEKYITNKDQLLQEYLSKNGKIANADEARKLFADVGYKGTNAAAVQEPASAVNKDVWKTLLKNEGDAVIYAGGSGTGKTSAVKNILPEKIDNAGVILDGNLSTIKSAHSRIAEARAAGKEPTVVYVYRDPIESFVEGVVKRSKNNIAEGGRIVPTKIVAENHVGSYNTIKELLKEGEKVELVNNSLGRGKEAIMSKEQFDKITYPSNLLSILNKAAKELYDTGRITKQEYEAYIR